MVHLSSRHLHELLLLQLQESLTADNVESVIKDIVGIVQDLDQEDEQSEDNLEILTEVYSQIENLVSEGTINVTDDVSLIKYSAVCLVTSECTHV